MTRQTDTTPIDAVDGGSSGTDPSPTSETRQPVDEAVRATARRLFRTAREGALAVIRPDGHPAASRVLVASDFRGFPILLISNLSPHTEALRQNPRCSLLVGRTGKGDPLAHPRATLIAKAAFVDEDERASLRERFLARHRKAALYIDFPDFSFVRLDPSEVWLVGGFGRASVLVRDDVIDAAAPNLEASEERARDHMNADHADFTRKAAATAGLGEEDWRIATMDRFGFEIAAGDRLERIEFARDAAETSWRHAFVALAKPGD